MRMKRELRDLIEWIGFTTILNTILIIVIYILLVVDCLK